MKPFASIGSFLAGVSQDRRVGINRSLRIAIGRSTEGETTKGKQPDYFTLGLQRAKEKKRGPYQKIVTKLCE
jgi:hypothetical protein